MHYSVGRWIFQMNLQQRIMIKSQKIASKTNESKWVRSMPEIHDSSKKKKVDRLRHMYRCLLTSCILVIELFKSKNGSS